MRNFLAYALIQPARGRGGLYCGWSETPRAIWAVSETKERARSRSQVPYTRLAAGQLGRNHTYRLLTCSFQGAVKTNRRAPCRPPLWPIEVPLIAPSFHEPFGGWPDIPS